MPGETTFERPASFAGLSLDRPLVMGIVNVTPDSFSDGGCHFDPDAAFAHGMKLLEGGADILDVGGESTRPGAAPIDPKEELRRVVQVTARLVGAGAKVSVDTRNVVVMRAALDAGASIINDISALTHDPAALDLVAGSGAPVVLMHMQGQPADMQNAPSYDDVVAEVRDYLAARIEACTAAGVKREAIAIDPGIGFGKTLEHNLDLIRNLDRIASLGFPLLLGVSRKSFIARMSNDEPPGERLGGSLAAMLAGIDRGARIIRVHDVAPTVQALKVWLGVRSGY